MTKNDALNEVLQNAEWLFFDIGYTLVDEGDVWEKRCAEQAGYPNALGRTYTPQEILLRVTEESAAYCFRYPEIVRTLGYRDAAPYRGEYEKVYPSAPGVLEALQSKYRLGIIANQSPGLSERLERFGIARYFAFIFGSDDIGLSKPDPALYRLALEKCKAEPAKTVMIGDRLDNDVFPAKHCGMKTVRILQGIMTGQQPRDARDLPDAEIETLDDLL